MTSAHFQVSYEFDVEKWGQLYLISLAQPYSCGSGYTAFNKITGYKRQSALTTKGKAETGDKRQLNYAQGINDNDTAYDVSYKKA